MLTLFCILGASFLLSCLLTPVARVLATRWGLVDHPDARRKMHAAPIPVAGGLAVLASTCLVLGGTLFFSHPLHPYLAGYGPLLLGLFLAAVILCIVGVIDDCHRLRGRYKLVGQMVAVGVVIAQGVQVHHIHIFDWDLELGPLAIPFTFFWLLGAINSLNLLDGMDGLLGCVGAIISLALGLMAVLSGHWTAACVAMALAGGLLGFLRYNLPPATIFLGDAGSMVIGLVLGVLGIQSSLKGPATIALIAPLAVLTIPILDTGAAVVRRKLTGQSIYMTDRAHLHHCLLRRGLSTWVVLLLISSLCLLTVLGALASLALKNELIAVLTALAVITILVVTRLFGHAEVLLIKKRVGQTLLGFLPRSRRAEVRRIEIHLQGTTAWNDLMYMVTLPAHDLNLQTVCLDVNAPALHEAYHARWDRPEESVEGVSLWSVDIPLTVEGLFVGSLKVAGYPDAEPLAEKIATLTRLMEEFVASLDTTSPRKPAIGPPHRKPVEKKHANGHRVHAHGHAGLSIRADWDETGNADTTVDLRSPVPVSGPEQEADDSEMPLRNGV